MSSSSSRSRSPSEEDPELAMDQRKRKRMLSNRESARRSRMRKQQRLDELLAQAAQLKEENVRIAMQLGVMTQQLLAVGGDNAVLRTQVAELTERLRSLSSVLRFVEEFSGMAVDIPEMPDPLLRPWQLPCPALPPIMASADMFQF
ncbi:uncharacterized protein M6B38_273110 [Iris pallida]|uniref:BZIP domain-containing protein n=1 Tax=Iris pallida TaxID=29817 RepID=A0AAX6FK57_IRIPA|nr:uncharacterized protein M6B38_414550 [Iris pallida]KAJ6848197.1 uncharacterized protein M6B38_273110 [Iris pallida]